VTIDSRNVRTVPTSVKSKFSRIEFRSAPTLTGNKLGGYAAVFDQVADLGDLGREGLAVGSLDRALATSDARSLFNHDPSLVLGRQSAGTLRLATDSHGLEYEVDLPRTSYASDLRELVERGDIDGASFAFVPGAAEMRDGALIHTSVDALLDASPVTYPAYAGASVEARSHQLSASRRRSQLVRARARIHLGG